MIKLLNKSIVGEDLNIIRNESTSRSEFKSAVVSISNCLAKTVLEELIPTGKSIIEERKLIEELILLQVLPTAVLMSNSFQNYFPASKTGFVSFAGQDNRATDLIVSFVMPGIEADTKIVIITDSIATGDLLCQILAGLQMNGAGEIFLTSIIAAPEGIEKIITEFPDVKIITASLEDGLNRYSEIVPGIGNFLWKAYGI